MRVAAVVLERLLAEAQAAAPCECCGLLLGHVDTVIAIQPAANVHPSPAAHFEIEPAALIAAHRAARRGGPQVVGYYHSHPSGPPEPSATDRALAAPDGKVWAIIGRDARGGWEARFWRSAPDGFQALPSPPASR